MRPNSIVVTAPTLDDDFGFPQRVEYLAIEQFIAQAGVETLDVARMYVIVDDEKTQAVEFDTNHSTPPSMGIGPERKSVACNLHQ